MMELFISNPHWIQEHKSIDDLHQVTIRWQSETEFWKDEIRFFQDLIDKHFMQMVSQENLEYTEFMVDELTEIRDKQLPNLNKLVQEHETHLGNMLDHKDFTEKEYRFEHIDLAKKMLGFMKDFKVLKKDVFLLVEKIREKQKQLELK